MAEQYRLAYEDSERTHALRDQTEGALKEEVAKLEVGCSGMCGPYLAASGWVGVRVSVWRDWSKNKRKYGARMHARSSKYSTHPRFLPPIISF